MSNYFDTDYEYEPLLLLQAAQKWIKFLCSLCVLRYNEAFLYTPHWAYTLFLEVKSSWTLFSLSPFEFFFPLLRYSSGGQMEEWCLNAET